MLDADDSFKDFQDWLDKLYVHAPEFFPEGTTMNDIVFVNGSVISARPIMTDDKTLHNFWDKGNALSKKDKDGDASNETIFPQSVDYCEALDLLQD